MDTTLTRGGGETKGLKIDGIEERKDTQNYVDAEGVVRPVQDLVSQYVTDQEQLLAQFHDEIKHYDYMFRCGRSTDQKALNTPMKTAEEPRSDVGASMFFRQIMQSAAKTFSLQHGRDVFFKYVPVSTAGIPYSAEDGRLQAEQLNTLAKWNLDQDDFENRILAPIDMMIPRDGLAFLLINWLRKKEKREFVIPGAIDEKTGTAGEPTKLELELLTENRASFSIVSPFSVRLDPYIDNIQDQECFTITDLVGLTEVISMVKQGYWSEEAFKQLTASNRWNGVAGNLAKADEAKNAGLSDETSANTGKYLLWRSWINLPIDDTGSLDEKTVVPQRFICDFLGNKISEAVCMRIERNDDPDDEIPVEVVHDYPDSPDRFFHISKGHVLKNDYAVEVTAVNQMVDSASLIQSPPTVERKGAVVSTSRKFGRSSRIVVRNSVTDDIREFQIGDHSQTSQLLLQYIKDDAKMAVATDPAQMGEGLGARASATEASGVMKLSAAPSVMNAKYITSQLFLFIGRKMASYWKQFSLPEQVIQITDSASPVQDIRPHQIYAQFDVRVDVVDEVVDDIVEENKLSQDLALFSRDQNLGSMVDLKGLLEEYFIRRYKKPFISNEVDYDAKAMASKENELMMREGKPSKVEPTQNHRVHLDAHRAERLRYNGLEQDDRFKQVELIDNHILEHEAAMGSKDGGRQPAQPEALPKPQDGLPLGGAGDMPATGAEGAGAPPNAGQAIQKGAGQ